jgi:hypothetical protein
MTTPITNHPTAQTSALASCTAALLALALPMLASAETPTPPIKIVPPASPNAADFDISVDSSRVAQVAGQVKVEGAGREVAREQLAARDISAVVGAASNESRLAGPSRRAAALPDGVYARVIEVTARLRNAGPNAGKPLTIVETQYFRVENGVTRAITSEEYTDAVQPAVPSVVPGVGSERAGVARDMGITRSASSARIGPRADDAAATVQPPNRSSR